MWPAHIAFEIRQKIKGPPVTIGLCITRLDKRKLQKIQTAKTKVRTQETQDRST